jgi:hypothetical protein
MPKNINIMEGINRVAWTQYRNRPDEELSRGLFKVNYGNGSGLNSFLDRQASGRHPKKMNHFAKD